MVDDSGLHGQDQGLNEVQSSGSVVANPDHEKKMRDQLLAQALRKVWIDSGETQIEFAEKIGISQPRLSGLMCDNPRHSFSPATIAKLGSALDFAGEDGLLEKAAAIKPKEVPSAQPVMVPVLKRHEPRRGPADTHGYRYTIETAVNVLTLSMPRPDARAFGEAYRRKDWEGVRAVSGCDSKEAIVNKAIGICVKAERMARRMTEQSMADTLGIMVESLAELEEHGIWNEGECTIAEIPQKLNHDSMPKFLNSAFGHGVMVRMKGGAGAPDRVSRR